MQQVQRNTGRLDPHVLLLVLEHDVVHSRTRRSARLAERHLHSRHVLQLDCHMLQHVPQPGALVLGHPAHESTRLTVRTAVVVEAWQRGKQCIDEITTQPARGPLLQIAQVECQPDHGKVSVVARPHVHGLVENFHVLSVP